MTEEQTVHTINMIEIKLSFEEQTTFSFSQDQPIVIYVGESGIHIEAGEFVDKMQEFIDAVRPLVRV